MDDGEAQHFDAPSPITSPFGHVREVRQTGPNIVLVTIDASNAKDWEQRFLLCSDRHWDNPKSRRDLQIEDLQRCQSIGAGFFDFGDFYCLMQGKYDKRSSKSDLRPEHRDGDYFDRVVETSAKFFAPYAKHFVAVGPGNHEASVDERREGAILNQFRKEMLAGCGAAPFVTGYTGWIKFMFRRNTERRSLTLWHTHGYGGGGPVTKDMIQRNRQLVYIDADMIVSGHTHDQWTDRTIRLGLSDMHRQVRKNIRYAKLGTYKDDYGSGVGGFAQLKGHPPKPIGQTWLRFYWHRHNGPQFQFTETESE